MWYLHTRYMRQKNIIVSGRMIGEMMEKWGSLRLISQEGMFVCGL